MQLQETRHFLFLSTLSPPQAAVYVPYLDAMHDELCQAYGIKDRDKVWLGKAVVVAFGWPDDFVQFQQVFFHYDVPQNIQGLANNGRHGDVVIACHCGTDPFYFGSLLVHETTHGFNYRYRSAQKLPSWLDEGIADWAAMAV